VLQGLDERRIQAILSLDAVESEWLPDLERLVLGSSGLTRHSAGEGAIEAIQRMLMFLGYSTSASGAFLVDGDFGRGTNRGIAQFQFENRLTAIDRSSLCYPCQWNNARARIDAIPEARVDVETLEAMLQKALAALDSGEIPLGRLEDALFHLNAVQRGTFLNCRKIQSRYGAAASNAAAHVADETGVEIRPEWILAIIRQETAGVVRPRFEQHVLSRENSRDPETEFSELRYRSMSIGLGQIMGFNFEHVGAASARALLFAPIEEQVLYVARFIAQPGIASSVSTPRPASTDYRKVAKYYNGPGYAKHHYHERLERWFNEFVLLRDRGREVQ